MLGLLIVPALYVDNGIIAMATVQTDIFKPTKYGGKYTVTLIPGELPYVIGCNSTWFSLM